MGTLPCIDCEAVEAQLDLWPDGVYRLRRAKVGKPGRADDLGRWRRDPDRPVVLLHGGYEAPLRFAIVGPRQLAPLDALGRPFPGERHVLTQDDTRATAEMTLRLHGMFRDVADSAQFDECLTGRSYPVATEGDLAALQQAYLARRESPDTPLMASFEGTITQRPAMEGPSPRATVVVNRYIGVFPGQACERAMSHASFADQYWRVVSLHGQPVVVVPNQREAHVVLRSGEKRFTGNAGCTRFAGSYRVEGQTLRFEAPDPPAPVACGAAGTVEVDATAQALYRVLQDARRWAITGQAMEWQDDAGRSIAVFEAVYLR